MEKEVSRDISDKVGEEVIQVTKVIQGGARPRGTNPLKRDGTMSKCAICESIFHWVKDCTDGDKSDRVNVHSMKKRKVMKGLEPVNHQTWKQMKVLLLLQLKS